MKRRLAGNYNNNNETTTAKQSNYLEGKRPRKTNDTFARPKWALHFNVDDSLAELV
jgi:hypothetical protein